jgi:DNA modification methylase
MHGRAKKCLESRMLRKLQVRFGVGAEVQSLGLHHVKVEPRSKNAIAAGLSSFGDNAASAKLKNDQGMAAFTHAINQKNKAKKGGSTATADSPKQKMRAKDRPLANDFVSDEEFDRLLNAWFGNIARVLVPGGSFYIWGGYANCGNYPPFLKKHELYFSQSIIWVKEHPVMTRKNFLGNHEWAFFGWKLGAGHKFYGPKNITDVWSVKKVSPQTMEHLTQKPAELAVRAMQYSSQAGENVLDLFGGSGSTLIGAEQTGRNAFLMELDPPYCDVIVDRYQRFTGKPAILERTGESPIPMKPREEKMR